MNYEAILRTFLRLEAALLNVEQQLAQVAHERDELSAQLAKRAKRRSKAVEPTAQVNTEPADKAT